MPSAKPNGSRLAVLISLSGTEWVSRTPCAPANSASTASSARTASADLPYTSTAACGGGRGLQPFIRQVEALQAFGIERQCRDRLLLQPSPVLERDAREDGREPSAGIGNGGRQVVKHARAERHESEAAEDDALDLAAD